MGGHGRQAELDRERAGPHHRSRAEVGSFDVPAQAPPTGATLERGGLGATGLLRLQRLAGNRAVVDLVGSSPTGLTVQREKTGGAASVEHYENQKLATLKAVPTAVPDPSYTSEGSKGDIIKAVAEEPFIVTGVGGTWHHIYPRNLLKSNLANISRYFVAVTPQVRSGTFGGLSYHSMETMASSFSMDADGKLTRPGNYYWKPGNGFLGVRSDYRADDPGQLVEHAKPPSMGADRYAKPRQWGKELERLSVALGALGTATDLATTESNLAKMADNITAGSQELDVEAYRSVDVEGKDWQRAERSPTKPWGAAVKNYKLLK
jgi:hypothetical protein